MREKISLRRLMRGKISGRHIARKIAISSIRPSFLLLDTLLFKAATNLLASGKQKKNQDSYIVQD